MRNIFIPDIRLCLSIDIGSVFIIPVHPRSSLIFHDAHVDGLDLNISCISCENRKLGDHSHLTISSCTLSLTSLDPFSGGVKCSQRQQRMCECRSCHLCIVTCFHRDIQQVRRSLLRSKQPFVYLETLAMIEDTVVDKFQTQVQTQPLIGVRQLPQNSSVLPDLIVPIGMRAAVHIPVRRALMLTHALDTPALDTTRTPSIPLPSTLHVWFQQPHIHPYASALNVLNARAYAFNTRATPSTSLAHPSLTPSRRVTRFGPRHMRREMQAHEQVQGGLQTQRARGGGALK
jgi:hypothetical protein